MLVPALAFLGSAMHLAVGTSLVAVWVNAAAATATHVALGARLAPRLPAARLQRAFGAFLVAAGAWLAVSSG